MVIIMKNKRIFKRFLRFILIGFIGIVFKLDFVVAAALVYFGLYVLDQKGVKKDEK